MMVDAMSYEKLNLLNSLNPYSMFSTLISKNLNYTPQTLELQIPLKQSRFTLHATKSAHCYLEEIMNREQSKQQKLHIAEVTKRKKLTLTISDEDIFEHNLMLETIDI
jgi:hypothetical protein